MSVDPVEAGINPDTFRSVLRQWASGVAVITSVGSDGRTHGMTASSFTSLSLHPPLVLVCVARNNDTFPVLSSSRAYAVNVLAEGQEDLSRRFAQKGQMEHSLEGVPHFYGHHGLPLLEGCIASLECKVYDIHEVGDHAVFVGLVLGARAEVERRPLLYYHGAYNLLAPTMGP